MEKTSFETLPEEMKMEILSRVPLKSLMRCMCVSKKWASIIRGKPFRDLYLRRSTTRPRVLFVSKKFLEPNVLFHSVYQEEKPLLSSGQQQMRTSLRHNVSQPIRGLICLQEESLQRFFCPEEETEVLICNPGTKKFLTLPKIQAPKETKIITTFFGYDGVTDVFKVLCIRELGGERRSEGTKEPQVLTVGSGEESWRRITCKHDHFPVTEGLCKGGVLYYGARSNSDKSLVMCFNVRSEDFTVIELPEGVNINPRWKLVNYNSKIALVDDSDFDFGIVTGLNGNGVFHMWVRDETAGNWWRSRIEIPRWEETVEHKNFYFKGTTRTKELVFALRSDIMIEGPFFVLYYDPVTQNLRRFKIEQVIEGPPVGRPSHTVQTFLDHVDSLLLCEEQELVH